MILCELCHKPIKDASAIILDPFEKRCAHVRCMHAVISNTFEGAIGTKDDEIDEMIADAVCDGLTDRTPTDEEVDIFERSI